MTIASRRQLACRLGDYFKIIVFIKTHTWVHPQEPVIRFHHSLSQAVESSDH